MLVRGLCGVGRDMGSVRGLARWVARGSVRGVAGGVEKSYRNKEDGTV